MTLKDAFAILNIQMDYVTPADIKKAYRTATSKYHPDHNPAGLEMMKLVNIAYETLKDYEGQIVKDASQNYGEAINSALNTVIHLGLEIEICGAWLWIRGNTRPHKEVLKTAGFKWAPQKSCWYFRPQEYRSFNRSSWPMDKIRKTYGSASIRNEQRAIS